MVAKRLDQPYRPGRRGWQKVRTRITAEAVVGGITGPLEVPQELILGRQASCSGLIPARSDDCAIGTYAVVLALGVPVRLDGARTGPIGLSDGGLQNYSSSCGRAIRRMLRRWV